MEKHYCPYCMSPPGEGMICPSCGADTSAYAVQPHHLPLGTVLRERYVVGGVLGEGGFGITYIGVDRRLEAKVAIKEYYPIDKAVRNSTTSVEITRIIGAAAASYERGKERFLREAKIMAKMVKQLAIVGVKDFFEANNTAYIVMEFVEGVTLKEMVRQSGPIPAAQLLPMLQPLFGALSVLHGKNLVHRDISPDNIMLEKGNVRLLDFGCAREADGNETQTVILKHGYAPVEQYGQKGGQEPRTDIYALSATIYYCLTGVVPLSAPERMMNDTLIPPNALGAGLSDTQQAALLRGLAVRPNGRYKSMKALHDGLYLGVLEESADQELNWERENRKEQKEITQDRSEKKKHDRIDTKTKEYPASEAFPPVKRHGALIAVLSLLIAVCIALILWQPWNEDAGLKGMIGGLFASPTPGATTTPDLTPTPGPTQTPKPTAAPGSGGPLTLSEFAGAYTLSADVPHSREELQALMDDSRVTAIVLRSSVDVDLNVDGEPFEVTKPLWVDRGAALRANSMTVSEGGRVQIDGTLVSVGLITLQGTGTKLCLSGALTDETAENLVILMDDGANLSAPEVTVKAMAGRLRITPVRTDGAVIVATHPELKDAVEAGRDVVIGAELYMWESLTLTSNLWISEGGLLTGLDDSVTLNVSGDGVLCNEGSVRMAVNVESGGMVYNADGGVMSRMEAAVSDSYVRSGGLLINRGVIYGRSVIQTGGRYVNQGIVNVSKTYLDGGDVVNLGRMDISADSGSTVILRKGGELCNSGQIIVGSEAVVENSSWIVNDGGVIELSDGAWFMNRGVAYNRGGVIRDLNTVGYAWMGGIVFGSGEIETAYDNEWGFNVRRNIPWTENRPADSVTVYNEQEFREALRGTQPVYLAGEIALDGTLEIRTPLYIGGTLTADSLSILSAPVVLCEGGMLTAQTLTLQSAGDDLADLIVQEGTKLTVTNALQMKQGSYLYAFGGELALDGVDMEILGASIFLVRQADAFTMDDTEILLDDNSYFISPCRGDLVVKNAVFTVQGSHVYMQGGLDLTGVHFSSGGTVRLTGHSAILRGCEIRTQGEAREFISDGPLLQLTEGTTVVNEGYMWLGNDAGHEQTAPLADESVSILNNGTLYVSSAQELTATIENNGTLYNETGHALRVEGEAAIDR